MIALMIALYIIQLGAVFVLFLTDWFSTQRGLLINLIPLGFLYFLYEKYKRMPWDD